MSSEVLLLSGPNLDELGRRDPAVYGRATIAEIVERARARASTHGLELRHIQSNFEGDLIEAIHDARGRSAAVIINPGALTHYSWSLRDALESFPGFAIELHLSNPGAREPFRRLSTVAPVVAGTIAGFGALGYELAVDAVAALLEVG